MTPPPVPFGDPTRVQNENRDTVKKGILFGCGGCGTMLALVITSIVGGLVLVLYFMRSSDVCQMALEKARSSPPVVAALGEPITQGWWVSGNINVSGSAGGADVNIPIAGPRGSAAMHVIATKVDGQWTFSVLNIALPDGKHVDLASKPDTASVRLQPRQQFFVHAVEAAVAEHNDHITALRS
jgi:hypothetical protein